VLAEIENMEGKIGWKMCVRVCACDLMLFRVILKGGHGHHQSLIKTFAFTGRSVGVRVWHHLRG
jgi:hypothetical protein